MEIKEPTVVVFIYLHKLVHMNARRAACHQSLSCNGTQNWEDFLKVLFLFMSHPAPPAGVDCICWSQRLAGSSP